MFHPFSLLKTAGLGAGIMYFFDPELGAGRRAKIKDQLTQVQSATTKKAKEKAQSLYDDATHRIDDAEIGKALGIQSDHWTPTTKTAVALGGVGLVAALLNKRDLAALALGVAGIVYSRKSMGQKSMGQSRNDDQSDLPSSEYSEQPKKVAVHNI